MPTCVNLSNDVNILGKAEVKMEMAHPLSPTKVLVVEDEEKMARLLRQALSESGFEVTIAHNGQEGYRAVKGHDVAVVDVMMPVLDGFRMVRKLRNDGNDLPVLFLTARDDTDDIVEGLNLGGDDYIVKPFRLAELISRIKSLLRRAAQTPKLSKVGDLVIDLQSKTAHRGERPLHLSTTEFRMLQAFMNQPGLVLSKDEVLRAVWENDGRRLSENVVEVYVHYLRSKLEAFGQPRILTTIKGEGYVLETTPKSH